MKAIKRGNKKILVGICPECGKEYHLYINGTPAGCDECLGIVRDTDGRVVQADSGYAMGCRSDWYDEN